MMKMRTVCSCWSIVFLCMMLCTRALADPFPPQEAGIVFDGLIEPHIVVEVGSEVPGIIHRTELERGDMVQAGQVAAALRSGVEQANLELAKTRAHMESQIKVKQAALAFAQRNSERVKELFDVKAMPFQKWDEVETQRIMAENELAQAREQKQLYELEYRQAAEILKRKTILSPVSGVVIERYLSAGEYVEDKPIYKIAQIDPLNVEVVIPVSHLGFINVGMTGIVKPEDPFTETFEATVVVVDKVVDAASGTFGVRLEMPNPEYAITPGLKCRVFFHHP
jgi:RND family efflux transporter MFP subunit